MNTYAPSLEASSGVVTTVKGGLKQHQRRLTWSQGELKMRVDLVFTQEGEHSQSWTIFHGNTLCAFDKQYPQEILTAVAHLELKLPEDEVPKFTAAWEEVVLSDVTDYSRPGKAWAKGYQLRNS